MLIIVISVLLMGISIGKSMAGDRQFIRDGNGRLISVEKKNAEDTESYSLHVRASRGGHTEDKDVILTFRGEKGNRKSSRYKRGTVQIDELERELDTVIRETEASGGKRIMLPDRLADGTRIRWSTIRKSSPFVFLLFPMIIIPLMYLSYLKKDRDVLKQRTESVRKSIPVFTDQVMILLSCGLIFADAFRRIADGYKCDPDRDGFFENLIVDCQECSIRTNKSLVVVLNEKAEQYRIRDFTRIVGYITDNQYRGVDLSGKLEASGKELWEERKKQAEEKGRLAETRLTMPLAVLLLVLILVTAAPAILQVKGGV